MKTYICIQCGCSFKRRVRNERVVKYCSQKCCGATKKGIPSWNKGIPCRPETKDKLSRIFKGLRRSPKTEFTKEKVSGPKNVNWIKDRTKVSILRKHTDQRYKDWRKSVCERDGWKCQVGDKSCSKTLQVHHIVEWSKSKKLRYQVSNGITLCKNHHPIKKNEVKELALTFQNIVNKNKK